MKYLFINSMSRTGTSLLYQLLYGHSKIYFAPYRIKFVCLPPFGFPLVGKTMSDKEFLKTLMKKTTIIDKNGKWPDITTESLANLFWHANKRLIRGKDALETAILTIHDLLGITIPYCDYYCLHDDHSYMLGCDAFVKFTDCKVLTTLREPFEMIASKKNMLVMYAHGRKNPKTFFLKKNVLRNELLRSVFSWWAASVESQKSMAVVYSSIKDIHTRKKNMQHVASYLGLPFENSLESDKCVLKTNQLHNELLANGSSISTIEYLTSNQITQRVYSKDSVLNLEEMYYLQELLEVPISSFNSLESFYEVCHSNIFKEELQLQFCEWKKLWTQRKMQILFERYSALNHGKINAQSALLTGGWDPS